MGSKLRRLEPAARHVLRSTGLSILLHVAEFILGLSGAEWKLPRVRTEPPKPVVRRAKRRGTAFARCLVHVLPALASLAIIILNICHLFLGDTLFGDNDVSIAILQVIAKIQELLVLSSLATIVFHRICNELISDVGLPLGFLCSGFTFSQLGYFWSPDFVGAVKAPIPWKRRGPTILLLVFAGLLALTAGPSVAVLLIPIEQSWDAGGSDFYLRGTEAQLFPRILNASSLEAPTECLGRNAAQYGYCPAGGFNALRNYVSQISIINNGDNFRRPLPTRLFGVFSEQSIDVASVTKGMPVSRLVGSVRGVSCQTAVIGSFLPALMYQKKLLNQWEEAIVGNIPPTKEARSTSRYKELSGPPSIATSIYVPAVRTACSAAQDLSADEFTVVFPVIPDESCPTNEISPSTITQLEGSVPSTNLRTTWVSLPHNFGGGTASAGLLFEAPRSTDNSSRIVIGCTVDARWANGTVENGRGTPEPLADPGQWGKQPLCDLTTPFRPLADNPWDKIMLQESWLQLLTPVAPAQDVPVDITSPAETTFEALLGTSAIAEGFSDIYQAWESESRIHGGANRTIYLEWLTTLLVADGLSRYGSHRALNTSGAPTTWDVLDYDMTVGNYEGDILAGGPAIIAPQNTRYTTYKAKITIRGLAYFARSKTDFISIVILSIHIFLAAAHTLHLFLHGKASTAWDSITELLTLTLNSRPPLPELQNTSAGIYCLKTFGKLFVIRSTPVETDDSSPEGEGGKPTDEQKPVRRVELILRDAAHPADSNADGNPSGEGSEGVSRRRPSLSTLLTTFAQPFAPDRAPYPNRQHELHWGTDSPALQDPMEISSRLIQEQSSSSSSLSSSSSSRKGSSQIRHRVPGTMDNDGVLFEKIVPNQEYA